MPAPQPSKAAKPVTPPPAPPTPPSPFLNLFVDGLPVQVNRGATVMDACNKAAKEIPHFCYHKRLSIAGNCRMCMVEIEGMPKPVASCHWPAAEGMKVRTDSAVATAARKGTMEFLLINHPLDCPICDQGGECTLQDLSLGYGGDRTHFHEMKRAVDDKEIGAKIKTVMTRCIHCTRCIRFATEIAGVEEFGATGRGENMQVGTYVEQALQSELAGNMIDLCPVGALTSKPYAYTARPWELVSSPGLDILDAVGSHIRVDSRAGQVMRVIPTECDEINEEWATDAARFSYDALSRNRLAAPLVKGKPSGWPEAFAAIKGALKGVRKARIAGLMDDMHGAEDAYAFNAFLKETLGTSNVDCRTDGGQVSGRVHAGVICNTPFADWDKADAVLLIGCNLRLEAPLLNVRIRRAVRKRRIPVASIGAPVDLTYAHTPLGDTPQLLEAILGGFHPFSGILKDAKQPLIIVGGSVLAREDGAAVLHVAGQLASKVAVKKGWNGFNVLQSSCGRITALDMAATPATGGMATREILESWRAGNLDVLFVYGQGHLSAADLAKGKGTLVYIGTHDDAIAKLADVVLPAAAWPEKAGLYANAEGRVQEMKAATRPPLNAKEDWKIFRALSAEIAEPLPFDTLGQLRALIGRFSTAYKPENWGAVLPAEWQQVGKPGKVSPQPFATTVTQYYLRTPYLRESANMQAMQAEAGTATAKKRAA